METLQQHWPMPQQPRPIAIIGAGGIVTDAHLPAYRQAGFTVAAIYDVDQHKAQAVAERFQIPLVCSSLAQIAALPEVVFDVALPPEAVINTLPALPQGATVLIQKPLGKSYAQAQQITQLCQQRGLIAAVNFQLRFSPMMLALQDAMARGWLGELVDVEVSLACRTPWELWPFMSELAQMETLMHSIHYLDWMRSLLGEPRSVLSCSVPHPAHPHLKDARSTTILDYARAVRCCISANHTYRFAGPHEHATVRVEGLKGAAIIQLGVLLNYPQGEPETLELIREGGQWQPIHLSGGWFPHAFAGVMANLQRFASGEDAILHTAVSDALQTMALVDACGRSTQQGGVVPQQLVQERAQ